MSQIVERAIVRVRDRESTSEDDRLAIEAPLEIRIAGKPLTVVMRTPGHDEELARGFLFSEGVIGDAADLLRLEVSQALASPDPWGGWAGVVDVQLAPPPLKLGGGPTLGRRAGERSFFASSSCGVCGKTSIAELAIAAPPVRSPLRVARDLLYALPDRLRAAQTAFAATGGLHASALFSSDGTLLAAREDVGRHNALDKLIGWALAEGRVPLHDALLLVSGRVSFEIVQKAIVAGLPLIAAVSAPSSLAVDLAERFGVTLVGFLRGPSMNLYAHAERLI
jgi:FdhD protein